jgi:ATP-dependent Clp endopeptidase proteolytic subunit ClpP
MSITYGQHVCDLQRIVRMGGPVDDDMANLIVAQLLYLDSTSNNKDIIMYVNSPGGSVTAGQQQITILQRPCPDSSQNLVHVCLPICRSSSPCT